MMIESIEKNWQKTRETILNSGEYPQELWEMIEKFAEELLVNGRPEFDVPHTHAVVNWAYQLSSALNKQIANGEIAEEERIDLTVIITAAWLHDIGYYGQFNGIANFKQVWDKKAMHAIVGAQMARDFLEENAAQLLNSAQIDQIVHLVRVHDDFDKISALLEFLLVESDTLGMIDTDQVEPTYRGEEALYFPDIPRFQERSSLFKTELGKAILPELIEKFRQFVIDRDFEGNDPRK